MSQATAARRRLVRRLITNTEIHNQEELRRLLAGEGFEVTQATVSRDLGAVGAVKMEDGNGGIYAIAGDAERLERARALDRVLDEFVVSVAVAEPVVVVKVPPGAAHLVASHIDTTGVAGVLGTVAGDDTLLVIARPDVGADTVGAYIEGSGR